MNEIIEKKRQEELDFMESYPKRWSVLKGSLKNILEEMEEDEKNVNGNIDEFLYNEYIDILRTLLTDINDD